MADLKQLGSQTHECMPVVWPHKTSVQTASVHVHCVWSLPLSDFLLSIPSEAQLRSEVLPKVNFRASMKPLTISVRSTYLVSDFTLAWELITGSGYWSNSSVYATTNLGFLSTRQAHSTWCCPQFKTSAWLHSSVVYSIFGNTRGFSQKMVAQWYWHKIVVWLVGERDIGWKTADLVR